jgi:hypothetical protein
MSCSDVPSLTLPLIPSESIYAGSISPMSLFTLWQHAEPSNSLVESYIILQFQKERLLSLSSLLFTLNENRNYQYGEPGQSTQTMLSNCQPNGKKVTEAQEPEVNSRIHEQLTKLYCLLQHLQYSLEDENDQESYEKVSIQSLLMQNIN